MSTDTKSWTYYRARVAVLSRDRAADDPELIAARRDLTACRLTDHISKALAAAPPLTEAQVGKLTAIVSAARAGSGVNV